MGDYLVKKVYEQRSHQHKVKAFASREKFTNKEVTNTRLRRSPRERKIRGSIPACAVGIFSRSSHIRDLKTGTPVATLPGAWRYRVSTGTAWPGISILWVRLKVGSATSISVW